MLIFHTAATLIINLLSFNPPLKFKVKLKQPIRALVSVCVYLYGQRGKVAVQLFGVVDVRLSADGTHHVSDVFVSHGDGEVHREALVAHGALT